MYIGAAPDGFEVTAALVYTLPAVEPFACDAAAMDYVQTTDQQRQAMLLAIGAKSIEDLYANLPQACRLDEPLRLDGLPRGMSELELTTALDRLANLNRPAVAMGTSCFQGAGAYDHFIPAVVDRLAGQGAFVTAYTPYQAEASQGSLQAFFEFQTQISRLTGLEVANASLYEGATAVAEAVMMALNTTAKRRVLIAATLHPHYLQVVRTYLSDMPAQLVELQPDATGTIGVDGLDQALAEGDVACLVIQSPNAHGLIEDWSRLFAAAHSQPQTLSVAVFNPIACGLIKRPGDCGADIAVGEGQPLGTPLQYGGPYLGLFATKHRLVRKIPGRLVGQTTDRNGRKGFCLTLQTREQHIRGAKATSNICTNQGLLALRASIYLNALGPSGLREVARQCYQKAHYAAAQIAQIGGYELAFGGPFFNEFVVNCPVPAGRLIEAGRARHIMAGLDCSQLGTGAENQLLVAVTEKRTADQIHALVRLLRDHQ